MQFYLSLEPQALLSQNSASTSAPSRSTPSRGSLRHIRHMLIWGEGLEGIRPFEHGSSIQSGGAELEPDEGYALAGYCKTKEVKLGGELIGHVRNCLWYMVGKDIRQLFDILLWRPRSAWVQIYLKAPFDSNDLAGYKPVLLPEYFPSCAIRNTHEVVSKPMKFTDVEVASGQSVLNQARTSRCCNCNNNGS